VTIGTSSREDGVPGPAGDQHDCMLVTIDGVVGWATARVESMTLAVARPVVRRALTLLLAEVDLTQLVRDNVDLDALMGTIDLDAIVQRIDVGVVAERVLQTVDVAAIIRESTEAVTSEAIRGVRVRGADADLAIGRTVDRWLGRRPHPIG
jgi:hypothetical protein